jgi:hypothetical protein
MSKLSNMSRRATIILVGSIIAILMVPTATWAASTVYNGIKGTSGSKADVTPTGFLNVSVATGIDPTGQITPTSSWTEMIPPGGTDAVRVSSINVDTWAVSPGAADAIQFGTSSNHCATITSTVEAVNPGGIGETAIDLGAGGLFVPASESLCVINDDTTNLHAAVFAMYALY